MQKEAGKGTSCGGDPHEGIKIDPNECKEGNCHRYPPSIQSAQVVYLNVTDNPSGPAV